NKLWNFIGLFYSEQGADDSGYVTEGYLQGIASQVPGLSLSQWIDDRGNPELAAQVAADAQAVRDADLEGTPSFLIAKTGGPVKFKLFHISLTNPIAFDEAIEKTL